MNTLECLTQYYTNHCDEDSRLRSRHGMVEYLTTMRYIEKYLFPGARIIEIGAGTGRYSHTLAQMGYQVDAVELIQHNIDVFQQNTQAGEQVTIRQGNALDLSGFADESYAGCVQKAIKKGERLLSFFVCVRSRPAALPG